MISYEVRLISEAVLDLEEIFLWYEKEAVNLGFRFLDSFSETVDRLKANPYHAFNVIDTTRRAIIKKFPYIIYYAVEKDHIVVFAVLHQSKDPQTMQKRL